MSKKSAKSKGYRHYKKEKPFLTKKEIYALIAIAAVVLIGFILFISYDDGALKIKDGAIEGLESNWIVTNGGTSSSPRYFKLGEAGEMEGFTHMPTISYLDYNTYDNYYYPTDESNPIEFISISTTSIKNSSPADLGSSVIEAIGAMEGYEVTSSLTEGKVGDTPYLYYSFTSETYVEPTEEETAETESADEEAADEAASVEAEASADEAAENTPNTFGQSMNAYVEAAHDSCLLIHVINETESPDEFLSDDELKAVLEQAIAAITLEKE